MSTSRNVMANMKAFAELKRNSFDISNGHYYSQKCAEIIPIKAVHTLPGDFMQVSITDKNLSFPMNTAAFLHARKEITTYHVPYNTIFSLFNQLQATRPDPKTSALVESTDTKEPRIALLDLYFNCAYQFYLYEMCEQYMPYMIRERVQDLVKQLDTDFPDYQHSFSEDEIQRLIVMCRNTFLDAPIVDNHTGINATFQPTEFWHPDVSVNTYIYDNTGVRRAIAFSVTFPYIEYMSILGQQSRAYFVNRDAYVQEQTYNYRTYMIDIVGRFRCYSWVRKLDMLGYGNLYPLFKMIEQCILGFNKDDVFKTDSATTDDLETEYKRQLTLLFPDLLNNIWNMSVNLRPISFEPSFLFVNLYSLCAYNKVFYDYFRNTYYDLKYNSRNYNLDFSATDSNFYMLTALDLDLRFLDIEYHQWKKDIVTGALPQAQYGAVAGLEMSVSLSSLSGSVRALETAENIPTTNDLGRWGVQRDDQYISFQSTGNIIGQVGSTSLRQNTDGTPFVRHTHAVNPADIASQLGVSVSDGSGRVSFDVLSLKRAECLQDYRQMLMRNGNRTIDIFKGLYGDNPASEEDKSPRFVDAFGSTLFVDTVVSTADTAQQDSNKGALGDLGARSVISSGGSFKFKTSDFGVLLFLGYIVPEAVYPSFGLDQGNLNLDPESHFIPFFQNLGFQPLHNFNRNLYYSNDAMKNIVRGYAPSYVSFKTDVDQAHGNFVSLPLANLVQQNAGTTAMKLHDFVGSFNHWVPLRTDVVTRHTGSLKDFYISPSYWDNIFIQKADADFDSDHFICDTHIFIKAVRKLSKLGLPNF